VALAEMLSAPLLTRDQRLAASAGHHARIELV
jgi:predicted nucleic acid-binding protein